MCMKKFDTEKNIFWQTDRVFNLAIFQQLHMGQVMRKRVLCYRRTTKVQISLRIRAVWSAPLLFAA